ncbi:MAG TPA: hypothetical protein VI413_01025 [Paludibacter sp.]
MKRALTQAFTKGHENLVCEFNVTLKNNYLHMKKSVNPIFSTFILPGIFCIAMGVLEAIVVIYLRRIYYPQGFDFPIKFLSPHMLLTEWIREIATIIMLVVIGIMASKDNLLRFLYFLFSFAIWDITYYVALKAFLNWPASLLTWDILFLIPVPWLGPVLAPVICSITMIFFAISFVWLKKTFPAFKIKLYEWGLILLGATFIFITFILDYSTFLMQSGFSIPDTNLVISEFVPAKFSWFLFGAGEAIILYGIGSVIYRTIKKSQYRLR